MSIVTDDTELHRNVTAIRWLGRFFLAIAALMTGAAGWAMGGDDTFAALVLAGGLAAVTGLVYYILPYAVRFWEAGAKPTAIALGAFWLLAFATEYYSHTAFTVGHRSGEIQEASFRTVVSTDNAEAVGSASRRLARLESDRAAIKPQRSAADARAVMAKAEAHRWWGLTESCSKHLGKQTREWCDTYRSAAADLEMWDTLARHDHTIAEARAELASLQAERKNHRPTVSLANEQAKLAAVAFTRELNPTKASIEWANMSIGGMVSLVFSLASAMCGLIVAKWQVLAGVAAITAAAASVARENHVNIALHGSNEKMTDAIAAMRAAIHSAENKLLASSSRG